MNNSIMYKKVNRIEKIIRHLSIFVLPENYQHLPWEILSFLIEQSFVLVNNKEADTVETYRSIRTKFELDFDKKEIEDIMKTSDKFIRVTADKYKLRADSFIALKEINERNMENEKEVYDRWKKSLKEKYPLVNDEVLNQLVDDLRIFFANILLKHGCECARIFYYSKDIGLILKDEDMFSKLPSRKQEVKELRRNEFVKFFTESDEDTERQKLIFNQLNASFIYRIISIEPSCSKYIRTRHFIGDEIFLDCNFLFSLLGLSSKERKDLARKVLEIAKKFNLNIYITEKTKQEYLYSLSRYEASIKYFTVPSPKVLSAAEGYVEGNPISAYWREYTKSGIGIDEFFNIHKKIDSQLIGYGISIMKQDSGLIERSDLDKEIERMKKIIPEKASYLGILEHDSFCLLYVRRRKSQLRNENKRAFFLTEDCNLLIYENRIDKFKPENSVCITPYQLLQILRPLLPRTRDFEKAFINAVTQPILRSQNLLPTNIATIILNRLSLYKTQPIKIVPQLLVDSYLTNKIKYLTKRKPEKINELIDSQALAKAQEVIEEKEKKLKEEKIEKEKLLEEVQELRKFKDEIEAKRKKKPIAKLVKFIMGIFAVIFLNFLLINNIEGFIEWFDKYGTRKIFWIIYFIINLLIVALFSYISFGSEPIKKMYLEIKSWFSKA